MKLSLVILYSFILSQFALPLSAASNAVDSIQSVIPLNTNLELYTDSVLLEFHPVKDAFVMLYEKEQVVVAEFALDAADSTTVWVKLAHSQERQGWIKEQHIMENFVPTDSISQFIYYFSHRHLGYFIAVICLFILICLCRLIMKKQITFVYFNDIDSLYPLFLCLLISFNATLYQSIQMFAPEIWQQYYFSPSLSPHGQPPLLAALLAVFWLMIIIILAVTDVVFKQLKTGAAFIYMLGLFCACIFCYIFFIFTVRYYIGYLFFTLFTGYFLYRFFREFRFRYRCGYCGGKMKKRGVCEQCGTRNT